MTTTEFETFIRDQITSKVNLNDAQAEAWVLICKNCFAGGVNEGGKRAIDVVSKYPTEEINFPVRADLCTLIFQATEPDL